jgi:hypothetical protein
MSLFKNATIGMILGCSLAGCGTYLPVMDLRHSDPARFNDFVRDVAIHVRCELRRAVKANTDGNPERLALLDRWAAKIALNMKVIDEGTVNPSFSGYNVPMSFVLAGTGSYRADATREMTITYFLTLHELITEDTAAPDLDERRLPIPCNTANDGGAPIGGDLGIEQTLESAFRTSDTKYIASDVIKGGPFDTITHHVNFTVVAGATATPTWKLVRVSADTSGTLLGANRTTYDDLLITLGPTELGTRQVLKNGARRTPVASSVLDQTFFTERLRSVLSTLAPNR